jgi:dTDP-4-amino-4,6-dideoxygalactose transaminase
MNKFRIPFNKPCFEGKELVYIAQAISNGHVSGDGEFTKRCHEFLEREIGVAKAFLTTSCTHALEMAAILLDLRDGDEIVVPSFTFVSTANAFALHGATPVFIDVRPDTLNLDESLLENLITEKTRAVVPVHYAGVGCAMDTIIEIAERHGVSIIEDNSHGLFGKYNGKPLGSFGAMATQSFHETKNVICGEGGALLIQDQALVERAEIIREKGTNRSRVFRGEADKYTWVDFGSSFLPSDMLAGFLYAQLEARAHIQEHRRRAWEFYYSNLAAWAKAVGAALPAIPEECEHPYHLFYVLMPTEKDRDEMLARMAARGVMSVFHYLPLHLSKMGKRFGGQLGQCPVAEDISGRLLRLPFYNDLSQEDLEYVVESVQESFPAR